jgi:transposase-like protein
MPKPRGYPDKLDAVRQVLWNRRSFRSVARDRKIDHQTVANWVKKYQQTGKVE